MSLDQIFRADAPQPYHAPRPEGIRVRLDANESPYPLPHAVAAELAEVLATSELHRYPDPGASALRPILAAWSGLPVDRLVLGNGSDELITLITAACARPRPGQTSARIAFPAPSFVMYRLAAQNLGVEPVTIPLGPDFDLDPQVLERTLASARPNVVFLAWPNNPTGTLWSRPIIEEAIARHPDILFVVDEAYGEYSGQSFAGHEAPNLVILRTLSKLGLAALRVGYCAAPEPVRVRLEAQRAPYNVGSLAQRAAAFMLERHGQLLREQVAQVVGERGRLAAALASRGRVFDSAANLIMIQVRDAQAVWQQLVARGILVRNFDPAIPGCLRVSVGTPAENDALLEAWPA